MAIAHHDEKCSELAEYFLDVRIQGDARARMRLALANAVQEAVEDWLDIYEEVPDAAAKG